LGYDEIMPNGGSDCCGTCPFNGVNRGKAGYPPEDARDFRCELRGFGIANPFWTYCNNHPRRNPLLIRRPRGPVWSTVIHTLDSKPFRPGVRVPPELLPPQGDGMYVRVPYLGGARPGHGKAGTCTVCREGAEETVALDALRFCSVAHYLEWWLRESGAPARGPLTFADLRSRLERLRRELVPALASLRAGDPGPLVARLEELDDLLVQLGYGRHFDLVIAGVLVEHPDLRGRLSKALLDLQIHLYDVAGALRSDPPDHAEAAPLVEEMGRTIDRFLLNLSEGAEN
jgi:hypothetical protein